MFRQWKTKTKMKMKNATMEITQRQALTGFAVAEATLADLMNDPMTRDLMAADHVEFTDLDALLRRARHFVALSHA